MSDDLISRKELADKYCNFAVEYISDECVRDSILDIIESMPTAFDKENVIKELSAKAQLSKNRANFFAGKECIHEKEFENGKGCAYRRAIEVVQKGGVA